MYHSYYFTAYGSFSFVQYAANEKIVWVTYAYLTEFTSIDKQLYQSQTSAAESHVINVIAVGLLFFKRNSN